MTETPRTDPAPRPNEAIVRAVTEVLSTRAILLLTIFGAFVLAVLAMWRETPFALATLGLYAFSAIPAVVYLEVRKRG